MMSVLFDQTQIKSLKLRNRFIRSATYEAMAAEDGSCTPQLKELIVKLAQGEVGLIITSHAFVSPEGQAGPFQSGIYDDSLIAGYQDTTKAVHENGCQIVMQIAHAGNFASPVLTDKGPLVLSRIQGITKKQSKEMSRNDIQNVVESFGMAAFRAKQAGFDAVQIHAAHGYFLSQSLSPIYNHRKDEYGGSIENRSRILLDIFKNIRSKTGDDYPVLIKMNCQDFQDNGLKLEDALQVAKKLQDSGIDAIELSGGTFAAGKFGPIRVGINSEDKEAYFRDEARKFRESLKVPLMLVGGIRSFDLAEQLVKDRYTDYISMSRPLICEPGLISRWKSGNHETSGCVSDNLCLNSAVSGKGFYCVTGNKGNVS